MPNDQSHDTRTTVAEDRVAAAVSLNVAGVAASSVGDKWPDSFNGTSIVFDGFENPTMTPTLNTFNFSWSGNNATSIVTMTEGSSPGTATVVWNNGAINAEANDGRDWSAKEGSHCLRFRYGSGVNMSEQRWYATQNEKEIWVLYWARVPVNFVATNAVHKFHSLWMTDYNNNLAAKFTWELWDQTVNVNGLRCALTPAAHTSGQSSVDEITPTSSPFIDSTRDRGRWMQLAYRVKTSSGQGVADGLVENYRRWEDESSFTLLHSMTGLIVDPPADGTTDQGWSGGFLMGYANDAYSAETEWLIDSYEIARGQ